MARPRSDIAPRIVHAARERFLQRRRRRRVAARIARDAGTSIGMIYYYFPTKDELFFAVVEEVYAASSGGLSNTALAPDAPTEERIRRLYVRMGQVDEAEFKVLRLVVREALISSARLDRLIERFLRGHIPLILSAVADGITEGKLRRDIHPALFMMAIFGDRRTAPADRQAAARTPRDQRPSNRGDARRDARGTSAPRHRNPKASGSGARRRVGQERLISDDWSFPMCFTKLSKSGFSLATALFLASSATLAQPAEPPAKALRSEAPSLASSDPRLRELLGETGWSHRGSGRGAR